MASPQDSAVQPLSHTSFSRWVGSLSVLGHWWPSSRPQGFKKGSLQALLMLAKGGAAPGIYLFLHSFRCSQHSPTHTLECLGKEADSLRADLHRAVWAQKSGTFPGYCNIKLSLLLLCKYFEPEPKTGGVCRDIFSDSSWIWSTCNLDISGDLMVTTENENFCVLCQGTLETALDGRRAWPLLTIYTTWKLIILAKAYSK